VIYSANFVEIAGKISHVDIVKYLRDLGWTEVESKRPYVKVFQFRESGRLFQADIPTSRDLSDYNSAMYKAVEQIGMSSDKSTEHVLLELLNPLSDIIRFQVKEAAEDSGTIKVEDAINLFENAKKIVSTASMDYLNPTQYHIGRPDSTSKELVDNCRFGQTEIGSYIVSLVLPFTKLEEGKLIQMNLFGEEADKSISHTRNVTKKIITSIQLVRDAIENGILKEMMCPPNDEIPPPVSANFLEALSSIGIYKEETQVTISVKWAPTVKENRAKVDTVSLNSDYYKPIQAIVQAIKDKRADEKVFDGAVSKLKAAPNAEKRTEGVATIVYLDKQTEKAYTAKVLLKKEDYLEAVEAHKKGSTVRVTGRISGHRIKTIDYSKFEVIW
jgi:hypothetical protein